MTHATIHFDGASRGNPGPAGAGAVVELGGRETVLSKHLGKATNNEAEYEGLLLGLSFAQQEGARRVVVRVDSQLIVRQLKGEYKVRAGNLKSLHRKASGLLSSFETSEVAWVPRERNGKADQAANQALDA
ncbi:MAG: ribonuclease HI family protein [Candidatus Thermoplasmatota archaeon]|nr:ribonuclease HI family protein [Candidatus Thermoplasmatota archaeon]